MEDEVLDRIDGIHRMIDGSENSGNDRWSGSALSLRD